GLILPEFTSVRTTAEAIGRIMCIKTGEEIGLLYQWDNGETQEALYDRGSHKLPTCLSAPTGHNIEENCG
ncbi:MAG: hypothetical protein ACE37D_20220, partial [Pseudomonadales bacterium]